MTAVQVGERFQLSERQARRARDAHIADPAPGIELPHFADDAAINPAEIVFQVVASHREALEGLRLLARDADNSSAAVGALRGTAAVGRSLFEVLAIAGYPPNFRRHLPGLRLIAFECFAIAERHGVGEAVGAELMAFLDGLDQPLQLTGGAA